MSGCLLRARRLAVTLVAVAIATGLAATPARAQSAANTGQVVGLVLDPSGAPVPDAAVTVRNADTNLTRTATTDRAGRYAVSNLPLGPYTISVAMDGFAPSAQDAVVALGDSVSANFKLALGGVTGALTVTAQASDLESTRTASKATLTELQIRNLPSNGRRVQNFVVDTPTALIEPECRGFSISGQKGIYANVSIDGGDYDGAWSCGIRGRSESGPTFGLEALQEIQVVRNGFNAEFGRTTGGVIQMSTKSGTNLLRGSGYEFFRGGDLAAADAFDRTPIASVHQFGGSLGGPIATDRTFFFIAPEFQVGSKPVQVVYSVLDSQNLRNTPGANALLAVAPEGPFDAISNSQSVITRVDHRLSNNDMLLGRFDFTRNLQTNSPGANGLSTGLGIASTSVNAASNQVTQPDDNYTAVGQWTSAISAHFLNEARVQFAREVRPRVHLGEGPQVTVNNAGSPVAIYGTAPEGSWGNVGFESTDNRVQLVDNFSIVSGAHTAKIGVDYQRISGTALYDQSAGGAYTFNSLADYLNRSPAIYTQFTGSGSVDMALTELAFYVQDEWRVLPGVTISPGLRYEAQLNPDYFAPTGPNRYPLATHIPDDTSMIDPRLGLAWDVNNQGRTVVRAGGGLYHAPTYMSLLAQSLLFNGGNPDRAFSVSVSNPAALAAAFQRVGVNLATAPLDNLPVFTADQFAQLTGAGAGLNAVSYFDPNFRNPRALQWQTGIEHRLARGITVSEQFTYINTTQVARERDTNLGLPTVDATGRNIYSSPKPFPTFGVAQVTESAGRSLYRGFTTTVNIRRGPATLDVYYTRSWNKSYDDVERGFTSVRYADVNDIRSEYNYSNIDEPHQFLVNGNVLLPYHFAVGTVMRFTSGRPFNATAGTDLNKDGQNTDRPIVDGVMLPRNAFRNVGYKNVDLRIQRDFAMPGRRGTISIMADLLNAFGADNVQLAGAALTYGPGTIVQNGNVVPQAPPAAFGQLKNSAGQYYQYNVAGDPFQAQLGVRFQF